MQLRLVTDAPQPDFEDFYQTWPKGTKKGREAADRAWKKRMREGKNPAEIIDGLKRYIAGKESWRNWMHPATFLNGHHWTDEYETDEADEVAAVLEDIFK